ncbi:MAG: hypothetical protein M1831_001185 [Alyxoria varia]|nr:MAG: hypothetical protein M1831_001185 [Alyxoria varia]
MPDLFHGDTVPLGPPAGFDIMEWFSKGDHGPSNVDPTVTTIIKHMRDQLHVANIGAVGYCFGAKYVARYLGAVGKEKGAMVDAGFMAHPSFVEAEEELEKIEGPLSIAAAENDTVFTVEKRHESERVLKGVSDGPRELPYQINLYGYVSHGFAVKGDPAVKRARFAKEQAFLQAVTWFDTWIKE